MGMTPQYFHTIPISCVILPTIHSPKLTTCTLPYSFLHPLNEHGTQHCSLHNLPHKRKSICHVQQKYNHLRSLIPRLLLDFISQLWRRTNIQTQHCSCTPQLLYARQAISAMLSSNYIQQPPTIQLTFHAHQHALHTQHYMAYLEMAQDVGMV